MHHIFRTLLVALLLLGLLSPALSQAAVPAQPDSAPTASGHGGPGSALEGPQPEPALLAQVPQHRLEVQTAGQGSVDRDPDQASYAPGDEVTLTAAPADGWFFVGWSGDAMGQEDSTAITVTRDMAVAATFAPLDYNLIIHTVGSGVVQRVPDKETYQYGDIVRLTAVPAAGWTFAGWSGDATGDVNPRTVSITRDLEITATFIRDEYSLTIGVVGPGQVQRVPDQPFYYYGDQVTLTAKPALGASFAYWSGDVTGSQNPVVTTMKGDQSVTATFTTDEYTLDVQINGQGSVARDPAKPTYRYGDQITLTAQPAPGWRFSGWSGDLSGTTNPQTLTITGDAQISATFVPREYTLDVSITGSGQVSRSPEKPTYHYGDQVTLTATPQTGWGFTGWGGDLSGAQNPKTITITGNMRVTATFAEGAYTVVVQTVGQGSVDLDPLKQTYRHGEQVTLTANPQTGWGFVGWGGDLSGAENPKTITITADVSAIATFSQDAFRLSIQTVGQGSVAVNPDKAAYYYGERVTLTASPQVGWSFAGWGGDLSGTQNPKTITISGDVSATATFSQKTYKLVIDIVGQGSVGLNPDKPAYSYGEQVTLTASPQAGWSFDGWSGDLSGTQNPKTIVITGDLRATATFSQDAYTLVVLTEGQGSVEYVPVKSTYRYGEQVTLTAKPALGWHLVGWTGDASGSQNPLTITMTGNKRITATFALIEYEVTILLEGRGKVWREPNLPGYHLGQRVTLTAWAPLGWHFDSWGGDLSGNQNPLVLIMTEDREITATFVPAGPGEKFRAYLPAMPDVWPPIPRVPALLGISNPGGHGDYLVRWSRSLWAETYTLQEATNPSFASARQLYHGPLISHQVAGRGAGRYYYRAKAHNEWGDSTWSNVITVDVRWEREPNDEPLTQANGPIAAALIYYGTFPDGGDLVDYFYLNLSAPQRLDITLREVPVGQNYDLILENAKLGLVASSEGDGDGDERIQTGRLDPGRYYIRVVNATKTGSSQAYQLRFAGW